jgi:hypothetical protein
MLLLNLTQRLQSWVIETPREVEEKPREEKAFASRVSKVKEVIKENKERKIINKRA